MKTFCVQVSKMISCVSIPSPSLWTLASWIVENKTSLSLQPSKQARWDKHRHTRASSAWILQDKSPSREPAVTGLREDWLVLNIWLGIFFFILHWYCKADVHCSICKRWKLSLLMWFDPSCTIRYKFRNTVWHFLPTISVYLLSLPFLSPSIYKHSSLHFHLGATSYN